MKKIIEKRKNKRIQKYLYIKEIELNKEKKQYFIQK